MARLNEPPVSTDSIETLRRKFLRQNRDIARINSTQSLRIRSLENECSRLLSENLDLRGQIVRLEKELEDNSSQRIADHALDIKARMEAQLVEWGALLAGLGLEPPLKRRSPRGRRMANPRPDRNQSPAQRRTRDVTKDLVALALQDGRLPSISENKPYPRATMNSEEILALCSEAADSTDSPDLGPPPVSRFVDEDMTKMYSPSRRPVKLEVAPAVEEAVVSTAAYALPENMESRRKPTEELHSQKAAPSVKPVRIVSLCDTPQPAKSGSKRKFGLGDENDSIRPSKDVAEKTGATKSEPEKSFPTRELLKRKSIKDLPAASRREAREKSSSVLSAQGSRKPLSTKSSNEDFASPKKAPKHFSSDTIIVKPASLDTAPVSQTSQHKRKAVSVEILNAPPRIVLNTSVPELARSPLEPAAIAPDSPEPSAARETARDTPPPADISSQGEASRPNRRARASISYAEPNLRDKMRRPTKELFDAVAGEGKFIHRASYQKTDEPAPGPAPGAKFKTESDPTELWKSLLTVEAARDVVKGASPSSIVQQDPSSGAPPNTVPADRRRRYSSMAAEEIPEVERRGPARQSTSSRVETKGRSGGPPSAVDEGVDVYDFTTTSPDPKERKPHGDVNQERFAAAKSSRHPRRSSALPRDAAGSEQGDVADNTARITSTLSRKRVSMVSLKKSSLLDMDGADEGSFESVGESENGTEVESARDRISRRRSMML